MKNNNNNLQLKFGQIYAQDAFHDGKCFFAHNCELLLNGSVIIKGKKNVAIYFDTIYPKIKTKIGKNKIRTEEAIVEKSDYNKVEIGSKCCAYFRESICIGYSVFSFNRFERMTQIAFYTDSNATLVNERRGSFHIPKSGYDAVKERINYYSQEMIIITRPLPNYPLLEEYIDRSIAYSMNNLNNHIFDEGIINAGGYLYSIAMAEVLKDRTGESILSFNEEESITGKLPEDSKYLDWLESGYYGGQAIMECFTNYISMSGSQPKDYNEQLRKSFRAIVDVATKDANCDLDQGEPISLDLSEEDDKNRYGHCLANPIITSSVKKAYEYLDRIVTFDGQSFEYERESAHFGVPVGNKKLEAVDAYTIRVGGKVYTTLYISPYGKNGDDSVPNGFKKRSEFDHEIEPNTNNSKSLLFNEKNIGVLLDLLNGSK